MSERNTEVAKSYLRNLRGQILELETKKTQLEASLAEAKAQVADDARLWEGLKEKRASLRWIVGGYDVTVHDDAGPEYLDDILACDPDPQEAARKALEEP